MTSEARVMTLVSFNDPLEERSVPMPSPGDGMVLVRMDASGVCGSDVHMWRGEDPRTPLPIVLGHEGVGTIIDLKGDIRALDGESVKPGDRIIWNRGITCGRCWYCAVAKQPSLCMNRRVYGINIPSVDPPGLNGCHADHIMLRPGTDIIRVPDGVESASLAAAACSGATVAHAFAMLEGPLTGAAVVVQGPGPLGMFAVAFARDMGAENIVLIGGTDERLALAGSFGATKVLNRRKTTIEDRRESVAALTGGRGADVVIEATGANGAALEGIRLLRRGGTFLSTGYSQPAGTESVDFFRDVVLRNATIRGVWVSDASHLAASVSLVARRREVFARLVTHRYPLESLNEALKTVENREALKAVITFD